MYTTLISVHQLSSAQRQLDEEFQHSSSARAVFCSELRSTCGDMKVSYSAHFALPNRTSTDADNAFDVVVVVGDLNSHFMNELLSTRLSDCSAVVVTLSPRPEHSTNSEQRTTVSRMLESCHPSCRFTYAYMQGVTQSP